MSVIVHPADVQDRDGARELLRTARRSFPFIETIFADGGYQGPRMAATVATTGCWKLEIVKRTDAHRFVALPKRWIVERTFAWISRNRRLARDFVSGQGHVLTNEHVIDECLTNEHVIDSEVRIPSSSTVHVVSRDTDIDLALLKMPSDQNDRAAKFRDGRGIRAGRDQRRHRPIVPRWAERSLRYRALDQRTSCS